ncbi:MAG: DedA family protein [Anaerolineales bacterium]|nr:DedA family protein [Anaerolineales bacterium]
MTVDLDLTETFLYYVVTFGPPALGATLFLAALGIPLPGTLFVLAAGAFVRQGVLDIYQTVFIALIGVVIGDLLSYGLGRLFRGPVLRRFGEKESWRNAEANFQRRGGLAIYLTRFLLTPLALPTNLIAGTSAYPVGRFVLFDLAGESTWIVLYGLIGYLVGSQWEMISDLISSFSGVLVGAVLFGAGLYLVGRWARARRAVRGQEEINTAVNA